MNDFAGFFSVAPLRPSELAAGFSYTHIKDTICFLCKQQIFSPGLLTGPVLIMTVAGDGGCVGGERPIIFLSFSLSFFFCPKPFFHSCCYLSEEGSELC